ncbi:response regulator [Pontibacter qinzhouensis]|uniref:Response regulator n=1 Tax=Pontibacter qinzhouensis TaxID=2603253 RepID=A0A5C8K9B6_9BACT|nr:response regulator [Pontibacter qinzhouensis]TXK48904.1 response regulator [Pontibacter qinzhouensis]
MQVFVIDDDEISTFLAEQVLLEEDEATSVSTFASASDAFETLTKHAQTDVPEMVLLDLHMPEMSGWEFLDALRPYEQYLYGRCHIYILSSSLDPEDETKAGLYTLVSGFLQKPIDPDVLQALFSQVKNDTIF